MDLDGFLTAVASACRALRSTSSVDAIGPRWRAGPPKALAAVRRGRGYCILQDGRKEVLSRRKHPGQSIGDDITHTGYVD